MRICMVTNTYLPHVGGVARSVDTFTSEYRRMGHHVLVIAPTFPDAKHGEPGVARVPALQEFNGSDFSVRIAIPGFLHQALDEFEPQVVHSHHPFLMGDTALRIARQRELPLVFTHHTLYERYTHYVPFDSDTMKRLAIKLSTDYANLCSRVVAPSETVAELLQTRGVAPPIDVVPTGVDVPFYRNGRGDRFRRLMELGPDAFVIGYVGRLAGEKNLQFLSRAVAAVLKQRRNAVFLAVGKGDERDQMETTFAECGVDDRAFFAGSRTGQELADAYNAIDVFTFSSHTETQGMVLAEAMSAGLPCVALEASGVREVIRNNDNGILLAEDAKVGEFTDAVLKLQDDEQLRTQFGETARATAESFSKERCARKMLEIYEDLINQGASADGDEARDAWDQILIAVETEWDLISSKFSALSSSMFATREKPGERQNKGNS